MDSIGQRLTTAYASAYAPFVPAPPRRASTTATTTSTMPSQSPAGDGERRGSMPTVHNQTLYPVRTRSVGGWLSAAVVFERDPASPPTDEDIIIVTVRLSKKQRRNSYDDPLPDRYVLPLSLPAVKVPLPKIFIHFAFLAVLTPPHHH